MDFKPKYGHTYFFSYMKLVGTFSNQGPLPIKINFHTSNKRLIGTFNFGKLSTSFSRISSVSSQQPRNIVPIQLKAFKSIATPKNAPKTS